MPEPRLSEERIDWLLDREVLRTPQSVHWNILLEYAAALRQLRGDLEVEVDAHKADIETAMKSLGVALSERDQARAQVRTLREALQQAHGHLGVTHDRNREVDCEICPLIFAESEQEEAK